jgi:DNA repair protein RadC
MTDKVGAGRKDDMVCPLCQSPYQPPRNKLIRTTKDVLSCVEHFRSKKQEYFICLSLDSGQRLIAQRIVTIGLLDSTLVHPREVFAGPLTDRAASIVVIHNHPSGAAEPSSEDIKTTQQLVAASLILRIPLKDHIIVTTNEHFSFCLSGLL